MLRPYGPRPRLPLFRPRHHGPQFGADLLDRMLRTGLAQRLEPAAPAPGLGDPLPCEAAGLDVGQDALHRGAHFRRHDLRTAGVIAVFRGVADRVPHELHAAAIHQVHDQLQLVHALEVGDLRRVPCGREGFEAGLDQRSDAPHSTVCSPNRSVSVSSRNVVSNTPARAQPIPAAYASASAKALPLASWCTATSAGTPRPAWNSLRTRCPGDLGAIIATSTLGGGTISRKCTLKP